MVECRWCALGVPRNFIDGKWKHLRKNPVKHLRKMGYSEEIIKQVGNQWKEVTSNNNLCLSMHPQ